MENIEQFLSAPVTLAGVEFLPVISFGHLLTAALTIVAGILGFGKLVGMMFSTRGDVNELRRDVRELRFEIRNLTSALLSYKTSGILKDEDAKDVKEFWPEAPDSARPDDDHR